MPVSEVAFVISSTA